MNETASPASGPGPAYWARVWKKFLRLTRGRVTVLRALEVMSAEEARPDVQEVLRAARHDMEQGATLSEALQKRPDIFSPSVLELVRSAEHSGAWDEILEEIAEGLRDGTFD